ncbi:hypothetical protein ACVWYN_002970 [Pedobacter sp. UYP24]
MTQENLDQMTSEELIKYQRLMSLSTKIIGICVLVMAAAGVFITLKRGFNVFTITPIVFLIILGLKYTNLKMVKEAVKARG